MTGPLVRILLRYGTGALVAYGILSPALGDQLAHDPDVIAATEVALGLAIAGGTELYYWAAKRWGMAT